MDLLRIFCFSCFGKVNGGWMLPTFPNTWTGQTTKYENYIYNGYNMDGDLQLRCLADRLLSDWSRPATNKTISSDITKEEKSSSVLSKGFSSIWCYSQKHLSQILHVLQSYRITNKAISRTFYFLRLTHAAYQSHVLTDGLLCKLCKLVLCWSVAAQKWLTGWIER
jgi:hypothetical protein